MNTENIHGRGAGIIRILSKEDILNSLFLISSASTILLGLLLVVFMIDTRTIDRGLIVITMVIFISGLILATSPYKKITKIIKEKSYGFITIKNLVVLIFWGFGLVIGLFVLIFIIYTIIIRVL